jgi:hypothetical protein
VRQGENLPPFLFSIYLNDLEQFLNDRNVNGLTSITEDFEIELDVYLKLFEITFSFLILTIQRRHIEQKYYQLSNNPS